MDGAIRKCIVKPDRVLWAHIGQQDDLIAVADKVANVDLLTGFKAKHLESRRLPNMEGYSQTNRGCGDGAQAPQ